MIWISLFQFGHHFTNANIVTGGARALQAQEVSFLPRLYIGFAIINYFDGYGHIISFFGF